MADDSILAWIYEHLLKLVELFVVVPIGIAAAFIATVTMLGWGLLGGLLRLLGMDVPGTPAGLRAVVRWPYDALKHIVTGQGGFQWTPQL